MKSTALVLFSCLFVSVFSQNPKTSEKYDPDKKYSIEQIQFDLAILKDALVKAHPGLYWYQTEEEFEERYLKLKNSIVRPMTELELYYRIMPFISSIRCSHTETALSKKFEQYFEKNKELFPFGVKLIGSKIYLAQNYSSDSTIMMGSELKSMNGIRADSIFRFVNVFGWSDGFSESSAMAEVQFIAFVSFYFNSEKYSLSVVDPNGHSKEINIDAIDFKSFEKILYKRFIHPYTKAYRPFRLRQIDSLKTAVIRIDEFEGKAYRKFLSHTFKTLKKEGTKNLIIDLRGNDGGEDEYGRILFEYLAVKEFKYYKTLEVALKDPTDSTFKYGEMPANKWLLRYYYAFKLRKAENGRYYYKNKAHENLREKPFQPKKNNFTGNLYVLIDDGSFSATSEFCSVVQFNKRAIFVGRETGGGYCGNTSGTMFILSFPNTQIRIAIPLIRYFSAVEGTSDRGVMPDHPLKEDVSDLTEGKDSDLLYTLDLIRQNK